MRSFIICTHPQVSLGRSSKGERGGPWERREMCTRFWWESPKERDHSSCVSRNERARVKNCVMAPLYMYIFLYLKG